MAAAAAAARVAVASASVAAATVSGSSTIAGTLGAALTPQATAHLTHGLLRRRRPLLHAPATTLSGPEAAAAMRLGVNERKRQRQSVQRDAIVRQLANLNVLGHGVCLIELGAGNGELSLAVGQAYPQAVTSDTLILLDRSAKPKGRSGHTRLAADDSLAASWRSVHRVKASVEDVDLAQLRDKLAPGCRLVLLAKHLCGAASDYALRAAIAASTADALPLAAVVLGTCCHHRCEWPAYPHRQWLGRQLAATAPADDADGAGSIDAVGTGSVAAVGCGAADFGAVDFDRLCRLSSRGVNAHDRSERADTGRRAKVGEHTLTPSHRLSNRRPTHARPLASLPCRPCSIRLRNIYHTPSQDLLDDGRVVYLREHGFDACLHRYVDASVTPENVLIVATPAASTVV